MTTRLDTPSGWVEVTSYRDEASARYLWGWSQVKTGRRARGFPSFGLAVADAKEVCETATAAARTIGVLEIVHSGACRTIKGGSDR